MKTKHQKRVEALARLEANKASAQQHLDRCLERMKASVSKKEINYHGATEAVASERRQDAERAATTLQRIQGEIAHLSVLVGARITA